MQEALGKIPLCPFCELDTLFLNPFLFMKRQPQISPTGRVRLHGRLEEDESDDDESQKALALGGKARWLVRCLGLRFFSFFIKQSSRL